MAYADTDDINGELKGVTLPMNPITSDVLTGILDQESAVIDNYLGNYYTTPITDTTALLVVKKICIDLVVFRVVKIMAKNLPDTAERDITRETGAYREAMAMLKKIGKGDMNLQGAERLTSKASRISIRPKKGTSTRTFEKDVEQW